MKKFLVMALLCFPGCVSMSYHQKKVAALETELAAKTERLKRFNQVDANGNLVTKKDVDGK